MIRLTLLGGVIAALGASAPAQATTELPSDLFVASTHCAIGTGGLQMGEIGTGDVYDYLAQVADARADGVAALLQAKADKFLGPDRFGRAFGKQVVYLEFNPGDPTFPVILVDGGTPVGSLVYPDYIYTQEDKDFIQQRLEADYALYDYVFTQQRPTSGEFSTLTFGDNDAGNITLDIATGGLGILFGAAENIDFRNDDRSDNAFIDASLWRFLAELDRAAGTNNLGNLSGLPVNDPGEIDAVEQLAVRNQSANTGAHELGHIQGLRHHDSIGAPGDGLPIGVDPLDYLPVGETEQNADETLLHTMASGASVGLPLNGGVVTDRFFAERSAVKLALNERVRLRAVPEDRARSRLFLLPLRTPNPLQEGVNADGRLVTFASLIEGRLDEPGEVDSYRFFGFHGQTFNAEIISFSDFGFDEPIVGLLVLSRVGWDGTRTEVARNRLTFEGVEPMIIDFELPATGRYVLEVSSPPTIDFGGGVVLPLDDFGLGGFEVGDYDLHAYIVDGR